MDPRAAEMIAGIIHPRSAADPGARDAPQATSFSMRQVIEPRSPVVRLETLPVAQPAAEPA